MTAREMAPYSAKVLKRFHEITDLMMNGGDTPPEIELKWQIVQALEETVVRRLLVEKFDHERNNLLKGGPATPRGPSLNKVVLTILWYTFPDKLDLDKPGSNLKQ